MCRFCPSTDTESTGSYGGCSTAAAMSPRHRVTRAHARSVSPGAYAPARFSSISAGSLAMVLSMIRRAAMAPTGSCDGTFGASRGHQATIGASGSRSGITRVSVRSRSGPKARSTTTSRGAGVTAHADLGVEAGVGTARRRGDDDDPARVLAARVVRRLDGLLDVPLVGQDHEREDPTEGDRTALVAQAHQPLVDQVGRGVRHVDDHRSSSPLAGGSGWRRPGRRHHGRLQVLPSRSIMASADGGPQVPDAYGSGWPLRAQ